MKYVVNNETNIIMATHDDNQDVENLYPGCTVYKSAQSYNLEDTFVIPPATKEELTEFLYQEKCKVAYGGVTVVKDSQAFTFETTQDSITMCNSLSLAVSAQADDSVISWKCWQGDVPKMLELTKAQFNAIFAFGIVMINEAFAVQGILNEVVQNMSEDTLADQEYVAQFKVNAVSAFADVATVFSIDGSEVAVSDSTASDSAVSGNTVSDSNERAD